VSFVVKILERCPILNKEKILDFLKTIFLYSIKLSYFKN